MKVYGTVTSTTGKKDSIVASVELTEHEVRFLCGFHYPIYMDRFLNDLKENILDANDRIREQRNLESSNGRKADSDPANVGSNPASRAEPEIGSTEWWDEHHKVEQYYG